MCIRDSYRCGAYACGIAPITTLFGVIPYLGSIIGIVWLLYLMVVASMEVHKIEQKKARMVFGVIGLLLVLMSTCSQIAGKKAEKIGTRMEEFGASMENKSPEEVGEALGEFVKGFEKGSGKSE
jgi:hypothetical protein